MTSRIAGTSKPHTIECVLLVAAVPVLVGLLVATVGYLGLRGRLPRNRFFGVRTPAALRDAETFRLANRVAGLPALVAGLVGILAGIAGLLMPTTAGLLAATLIGLIGMLAIAIGGGILGHRAALTVPEPQPELPPGCKGCACGNCLTPGQRIARGSGYPVS